MTNAELKSLVLEYLETRLHRHDEELSFFRKMPSLRKAVETAMTGKDHRGKMYSHQCRVGSGVLAEAGTHVFGCLKKIEQCQSFDELQTLILYATRNVIGFGKLAAYDISLRIGAYLDLMPEKVYLHCGTLHGARLLDLNTSDGVIEMDDLPKPISAHLTADQSENFLCYLANVLGKKQRRRMAVC